MKLIYASEYRAAARNMLCGRWTEAVLVGLVASLLCGGLTGGNTITFNFSTNNFSTLPQDVYYTTGSWALSGLAMTVSTIITILAVLAVILMIVVGGVVETGYARYNMEMVNGAPSGIRDLFTDISVADYTPDLAVKFAERRIETVRKPFGGIFARSAEIAEEIEFCHHHARKVDRHLRDR